MSATSLWVYSGGVYSWPGDFSYSAIADYYDNTGGPIDGASDIKVTINGKWGAWQPYAPNFTFNSAAYSYFTFALKPTKANQTWQVYFTKTGNVATGKILNLASYGAAPTVGVWTTYQIPLTDFGVSDASIGSFAIQDTTGTASNTWYVDNVGFDTPSVATPPSGGGSATVYNNGTFNWPGSFSYSVGARLFGHHRRTGQRLV